MDVKQIPPTPGAMVNASTEMRDGDRRRGSEHQRKAAPEKKAPLLQVVPATTTQIEPDVQPAESQLLDSKTVVELLTKLTTTVAQATATFSRHVSRRKPKSSKVIDEKKLNRQA